MAAAAALSHDLSDLDESSNPGDIDWDALFLEPARLPQLCDTAYGSMSSAFGIKAEPVACLLQASPAQSELSDDTQHLRVDAASARQLGQLGWGAPAGASDAPAVPIAAFRSDSINSSGGTMIMIDSDLASPPVVQPQLAALTPATQPAVLPPSNDALAAMQKHGPLPPTAAQQSSGGQAAGGAKGGRSGRACPSSTYLRLSHRRETNRAAQQRWRDRRKDRELLAALDTAELHKQLSQIAAAMEATRCRNAQLERLAGVAEAVPDQQAVSAALAAARSTTRALAHEQLAMGGASGAPHTWWLDASAEDRLAAELGLQGELSLSVRPNNASVTCWAQLATLPRDELASMWQAYTDDMASCMCLLHAAAGTSAAKRCADATLGRGDGSTASRLAQLVSEAMQLKMALLVARPIMEAAMADEWAPEASNANVGMQPAVDGSCPDDIWWQVIDGTGLSPQQKGTIIGLRDQYLSRAADLAAQRTALEATLQQTPVPMQSSNMDTHGSATDDEVFSFGGLVGVAGGIRETHLQQHACFLQTVHAIWARVLTPPQYARLHVCAFPAHPGALLCAEAFAIAAGRPSTADLEQQLARQATTPMDLVPPDDAELPSAAAAGRQAQGAPLVDASAPNNAHTKGSAASDQQTAGGRHGTAASAPAAAAA